MPEREPEAVQSILGLGHTTAVYLQVALAGGFVLLPRAGLCGRGMWRGLSERWE
jgi:hypothetical protein